jgi:hypothetical protein
MTESKALQRLKGTLCRSCTRCSESKLRQIGKKFIALNYNKKSERCTVKCPDQDPKSCELKGANKSLCRKTNMQAMSYTKRGKCHRCEETATLHSFEGTYDDPEEMMCEECIDEFHDDVHDAEDAMSDAYL